MKKLLLLAALLFTSPVLAQPVQCPDQPLGSSTNACANTRFVINNAGGGGISTLTNNHIFVGNASNVATDVVMSGDCSIVASGAITCTKSSGSTILGMAFQAASAVSITGGTITGLPTPTLTADAATKGYVDTAVSTGRPPLAPVRLATTTTLPANTYNNGTAGVGATLTANAVGILSIDSTVVNINDRLLVKNEAAPANNACYTMTTAGTAGVAYILTRCTDSDTAAELPNGLTTLVTSGTVNINSSWTLNQPSAITVGTTALPWVNTGNSSPSYWTLSSTSIYNNNAGNVGIGTTSPGTALDVVGTVTARNSTATDVGGTTKIGHGAGAWTLIGNQIAGFDLSVQNPAGGTPLYFAQANLYVGLGGTTNPRSLLDFGGNVNAQQLLLYSDNAFSRFGWGMASSELRMFVPSFSHMSFGYISTSDGTTWVETMRYLATTPTLAIGTTSPASGATFQISNTGSILQTVTDPTMQQALCYGFESPTGGAVGACETDGMVVNQTYTAGAATTGSAIRGTVLLQKGASTGLGVVGVATNYGTGVQSELVGIFGGANWYGHGSGNAVWAITGGTGADSGVAGAFEASNRASIAPAWGLRINAESPATQSYVTAADWADFVSFGLVLRNTQTAGWPIYITNNVGTQIYGVNQVGAVVSGSDSRLKNDKGLIADGALSRIEQLKPRAFSFKDAPDKPDLGFFAQEVQEVIPEAVSENDTGYLMLTQMPILANAIKAIQELKADNDNLRACQVNWKCRIFGWKP